MGEYIRTYVEYDAVAKLYEKVQGADIEGELTADLVGDYLFTDEAFVKNLSTNHRNVFQRVFDEIKYLCKIATAGSAEARKLEKVKKVFEQAYRSETAQKNPAQQDGVRYSISQQTAQPELTAEYHKTVDQVINGTYRKSEPAIIGYTPVIYQELGMPSLPFVIGPGHIYSIAKSEAEAKVDKRYSKKINYHGLGDQTVKDILERISDPVMIIFSKDVTANAVPMRSTHSVVAIADIGIDGESVFAPIEITAERTINGGQYDVNVLSSVYGKTVQNLVSEAIARENIGDVGVFYLNSKASALLADGVQFPKRLTDALASNGIVHSFSEKVNMNISDVTQSQQFKRWFGDWQNHPENASKIVNSDGTPKVVYHGSTEEFTTFSYGHVGSATGVGILGDGFYFTDKKKLAKNYGKNVLPVYLQMKNPYIATESDAYKLRVEDMRQQGFDGVILRAPQGDVYMVFEYTQIKSATDNIGTFDGNNPDIRYSVSSEGETMVQDGWRVSGEDVALEQENAADDKHPRNDGVETARNDADEFSAPTEEDIAQMRQSKKPEKLDGPLLMKDGMDRELEKLYRQGQKNQISDEDYFTGLARMEGAYYWEGRDFNEAFRRVTAAYEGTPMAEGAQANEKIRYKNYDEFAIQTNKEKLTNMKSVHAVPENKLRHSGKTLRESYQEYFDNKGGVIHSEEFGDIALTNSSIRSEIRHGSTAEKIASIEAIESVVQNGVVIYDKSKYNNDSHRIVVAAPIKIGNTPYYMGVMLQRDGNGQRLYIHDVTIEKETNDSSSVSLNTTVANEENGGLFLSNILQDAMRVKYPVKQSVDDSVASKRNEVNTQENNRARIKKSNNRCSLRTFYYCLWATEKIFLAVLRMNSNSRMK